MLYRVLFLLVFNFLTVTFVLAETQNVAEPVDSTSDPLSPVAEAVEPPAPEVVVPDVTDLFAVAMEKQITPEAVSYKVIVSAQKDQLDAATTAVVAHVKDSLGGSKLHTLKAEAQAQNMVLWKLDVPALKHARYTIKLRANAKTPEGVRVSGYLPAQFFTYPLEGDPIFYPADDKLTKLRSALTETLAETPEQYKEQLHENKSQAVDSVVNVSMVKSDDEPDNDESSPWLMIVLSIIGVIVAAIAGFFTYRLFKKRKEANVDELTVTDTPDVAEGAIETGAVTVADDVEETSAKAPSAAIDISDDDLMADLDAAFTIEPDEAKKPADE